MEGRSVMPCIEYKKIRMRGETLELINNIQEIIDEYQSDGYSLTLRQVYYQLVARGFIPNNDRQYKMVGNAVNDGRLSGLIDWYAIEDRTRYVRKNSHWSSPADIIKTALRSYYKNHWKDQDYYVEVWVEKDALIGIVQDIASQWDVPCFSCRGYTSQSEMWAGARRFIDEQDQGKSNILIHLGDHDPSGIDMSRDIQERLGFFGANVQVNRIALNRDQIDEYNPPPNPAKITDSRAASYIKKHGKTSWELDALKPEILKNIIEAEIRDYVDVELFEAVDATVQKEKRQLQAISDNYEKILSYKFMRGQS
jgi:hypothetical protein